MAAKSAKFNFMLAISIAWFAASIDADESASKTSATDSDGHGLVEVDTERRAGHAVRVSVEPTEDLHQHCPDFTKPLSERAISDGFTPECEARLDELLLDEIPPLMPITSSKGTITWRYVFERPLAKREKVLEVMADPICMSAPESIGGNDLSKRCHSEIVADFAVLKYQCASGLFDRYHRIKRGTEVSWRYEIALERWFDNDLYWQKRYGSERAFFRYAWIAAKCAAVPREALASLDVIPNVMHFEGEPLPGQENWWWAEQGYEAYELMAIASDLDASISRIEYGYEPETISVWQRVQPVMAEVLKVKNPGAGLSEEEVRSARLKHLVATNTWLAIRSRVRLDNSWLSDQVGEFSAEEYEQASAAAQAMMENQQVSTYHH